MSKPTLTVLATAVVTSLLAGPSLAQANYTIRVVLPMSDRGGVSQLGPWAISNPSLGRAMQVFGPPSSTNVVSPGFANDPNVADCALTWAAIGLKAVFTTLGIAPGTCNPMKLLDVATITSRRWQTWRGLRVGDSASRIHAREPRARLHRGVWWLATVYSPIGTAPGRAPTVLAIAHAGRISAFQLNVGAQGE